MTPHTNQTHDDQSATTIDIDVTLVLAARRAANSKMEPRPAAAYQLYVRKQGSGRPYDQPKKPRQEAVVCDRCGQVNIFHGRLPIFPMTVDLKCGHLVVLHGGSPIVLPAALFRSPGGIRVLGALRRLLVLPDDPKDTRPRAEFMFPTKDPRKRKPAADTPSAPPANGATKPDDAQASQPASPAAISPPPGSARRPKANATGRAKNQPCGAGPDPDLPDPNPQLKGPLTCLPSPSTAPPPSTN